MPTRPYHHGALRPALLAAAEQVLERDGLDRLSLRAIARAAGVSHAAPAHHFTDLRGLLTALATSGFLRLAEMLAEAAKASPDPLAALGRAYVRFARAQPHLFMLMFHNDVLDSEDPAFGHAADAAFAALARVTRQPPSNLRDDTPHGPTLASWCLVHGFAMLLLDGRLPPSPDPDTLLDQILGT